MRGPGRPFKKGQSGNPGGKAKVDPGAKALQSLSQAQFQEIANLVLLGQKQDVTNIVNDTSAPLFKRWLAKLADNGLTRGDQQALEFFLNRLLGKVPDRVETDNKHHVTHELSSELTERLKMLGPPEGE